MTSNRKTYNFYGHVWALQIWAYETIPRVGWHCAKVVSKVAIPRVPTPSRAATPHTAPTSPRALTPASSVARSILRRFASCLPCTCGETGAVDLTTGPTSSPWKTGQGVDVIVWSHSRSHRPEYAPEQMEKHVEMTCCEKHHALKWTQTHQDNLIHESIHRNQQFDCNVVYSHSCHRHVHHLQRTTNPIHDPNHLYLQMEALHLLLRFLEYYFV
ncbi:hypothetical protein C2S51_032247 [Perilla frutescens var. frutescens]|nr:hypothetical protein C2S51_032247 [Perilla frutescens var. frutescens]